MIKTIALLITIGCLTLNANAVSTKDLTKKTPLFLLFAAVGFPTILSKAINEPDENTAISSTDNNRNVTLSLIYQALLEMNNKITQIKHKTVDEYSDYTKDKITTIGIYAAAVISLVLVIALFYTYRNFCGEKTTHRNMLPSRRKYGINS